MLAGLLHDLGHYPCSHQLDHLDSFPAHEELTIALITGELKHDGIDFAALIRDRFGIEPDDITRFLGPDDVLSPELKLLKQIIDSPIDADKCDYLPRDSYYCGVDYGTGFDRDRFIDNLIPRHDHLCIHEKGLLSAERFQLARYWMYRSVYWGHTVRAFITMLSVACDYLEPGFDAGWPERLLAFNDHNFLEWLHANAGGPGRELIEMVHHRREPYKRVYTISFHHAPRTYDRLQDAALRDIVTDALEAWARARGTVVEDHHLIWDVPPLYKSRKWETFPIVLSSGEEVPINQESPVIEALSNAFLHGVRKIRLFCHPRIAALTEKDPFPELTALID
jgi:HD superfamily phosphohydrolase